MELGCKQKSILGVFSFVFIVCLGASITCAIFGRNERIESFKKYNTTDIIVTGYNTIKQICNNCNKDFITIHPVLGNLQNAKTDITCDKNPYTGIVSLQYYAYEKGDLYKLYQIYTSQSHGVNICGITMADAIMHAKIEWPDKKSVEIAYLIDDPTQLQQFVYRGEIFIVAAVALILISMSSALIGVIYLCRRHKRVVHYPPVILFDV